jgi:hypothetical protein
MSELVVQTKSTWMPLLYVPKYSDPETLRYITLHYIKLQILSDKNIAQISTLKKAMFDNVTI